MSVSSCVLLQVPLIIEFDVYIYWIYRHRKFFSFKGVGDRIEKKKQGDLQHGEREHIREYGVSSGGAGPPAIPTLKGV
jgi:hypothetical protein